MPHRSYPYLSLWSAPLLVSNSWSWHNGWRYISISFHDFHVTGPNPTIWHHLTSSDHVLDPASWIWEQDAFVAASCILMPFVICETVAWRSIGAGRWGPRSRSWGPRLVWGILRLIFSMVPYGSHGSLGFAMVPWVFKRAQADREKKSDLIIHVLSDHAEGGDSRNDLWQSCPRMGVAVGSEISETGKHSVIAAGLGINFHVQSRSACWIGFEHAYIQHPWRMEINTPLITTMRSL